MSRQKHSKRLITLAPSNNKSVLTFLRAGRRVCVFISPDTNTNRRRARRTKVQLAPSVLLRPRCTDEECRTYPRPRSNARIGAQQAARGAIFFPTSVPDDVPQKTRMSSCSPPFGDADRLVVLALQFVDIAVLLVHVVEEVIGGERLTRCLHDEVVGRVVLAVAVDVSSQP